MKPIYFRLIAAMNFFLSGFAFATCVYVASDKWFVTLLCAIVFLYLGAISVVFGQENEVRI